MNIAGLAIIILAVAGAVLGMYFIAANVTMTAPTDAYGRTTTVQDNLTRSNITAASTVAPTTGVWIALLAGFGIVISVILFLVAAYTRKSGWTSRYS